MRAGLRVEVGASDWPPATLATCFGEARMTRSRCSSTSPKDVVGREQPVHASSGKRSHQGWTWPISDAFTSSNKLWTSISIMHSYAAPPKNLLQRHGSELPRSPQAPCDGWRRPDADD